MSNKKLAKESENGKLLRELKNLKEKYEARKSQVGRLKGIIRELEKDVEKLTEELKCFKAGIEYKPKDISRPKKLSPEEKKILKDMNKVNEKEELKKKLKEKFGRKEK